MSRYLFVVPPLTGHINPAAAVAGELAARGHEVAWAGHEPALRPLLPAAGPGSAARVFGIADEAMTAHLASSRERWLSLRGPAALKFLWQEFIIPLARAMLPGVRAAVEAFEPDVVAADQQALAGALAARAAGAAWATMATTSAELTRPLAALPKVEDWVRGQMEDLEREAGLPAGAGDLRFSDQLVIVFSTSSLVGATGCPPHYAFVGPALRSGRAGTDRGFPWRWLDPGRKHVLASLGTLNADAGGRFYRAMIDAVAELEGPPQAVLVAPEKLELPAPPNVLIRDWVPQLDLLRGAGPGPAAVDAVVSHGGHNTVCETLAHGVPLVVAPIRDDQPIIAGQVVAAGAGIQVRFTRARATELRDALAAVLAEPRYRTAARAIAREFAAAGGAPAAASRLEELSGRNAHHALVPEASAGPSDRIEKGSAS